MLYSETLYGYVQVPVWEEKKLTQLTDDELLEKAIEENKIFCISPSVFAMVQARMLDYKLQKLINQNVGFRHL